MILLCSLFPSLDTIDYTFSFDRLENKQTNKQEHKQIIQFTWEQGLGGTCIAWTSEEYDWYKRTAWYNTARRRHIIIKHCAATGSSKPIQIQSKKSRNCFTRGNHQMIHTESRNPFPFNLHLFLSPALVHFSELVLLSHEFAFQSLHHLVWPTSLCLW